MLPVAESVEGVLDEWEQLEGETFREGHRATLARLVLSFGLGCYREGLEDAANLAERVMEPEIAEEIRALGKGP